MWVTRTMAFHVIVHSSWLQFLAWIPPPSQGLRYYRHGQCVLQCLSHSSGWPGQQIQKLKSFQNNRRQWPLPPVFRPWLRAEPVQLGLKFQKPSLEVPKKHKASTYRCCKQGALLVATYCKCRGRPRPCHWTRPWSTSSATVTNGQHLT